MSSAAGSPLNSDVRPLWGNLNKTQRFFRYVWRIDAVLILVAAAAAVCGIVFLVAAQINSSLRQREIVAAAPPVVGIAEDKELRLGNLSPVEGTSIYRAFLSSEKGGVSSLSSSGYSSDTRNILFLNLADGEAKWLLPSDKELITFNSDVTEPSRTGESAPPVATVILAKPYSTHPEASGGRLLLLDLGARNVVEVGSNVRDVHGATLTTSGGVAIVFERDRKYQLAVFARDSLKKLSERTIEVPQLK